MRKFYLLQNYEYTVPADPSAADNSPSIAITRCVGSPQFPQQQTDFSCNDNDNKIDGCKDNSVTEHWYSIFNISKRVVCKILDPSLLARQKRSLASIRFNCTPSAICTIDREQSTTTPQAEFFYSMPTHKSYQHLLGLIGFDNGSIFVWRPFLSPKVSPRATQGAESSSQSTQHSARVQYNENAAINAHPVTAIQQLPHPPTSVLSSPLLSKPMISGGNDSFSFLVAHADGCLYEFDSRCGSEDRASLVPSPSLNSPSSVSASPSPSPSSSMKQSVFSTMHQSKHDSNPRREWRIKCPGSSTSVINDMRLSHCGNFNAFTYSSPIHLNIRS